MTLFGTISEFVNGGGIMSVYWGFAIGGSVIFAITAIAALFGIGGVESASGDVDVDMDGEIVEYDLSDADGAQEYVDSYADNLTNDTAFEDNIQSALNTVRLSVKKYATIWSLLPPVIAMGSALPKYPSGAEGAPGVP